VIESTGEAGHPQRAFKVNDCWVSAYQALPDLDANANANANAVKIDHLKLQGESPAEMQHAKRRSRPVV
jgi:hypothetical protein